jgi:hypothetical protein
MEERAIAADGENVIRTGAPEIQKGGVGARCHGPPSVAVIVQNGPVLAHGKDVVRSDAQDSA